MKPENYFGCVFAAAFTLALAFGGYTHDEDVGGITLFGTIGLGFIGYIIISLFCPSKFEKSEPSETED